MAAAETELFNDVVRRRIVTSSKDASDFNPFPDFFHQDKIPFLFHFLKPNPNGNRISGPYSNVLVSGLSFALKLFKSDGSGVLAAQSVWTKDNDAQTLSGTLDLNTAEMAAVFPGGTNEISAILEGELNDGTGIFTAFQKVVKIKREWNTATTGAPTPNDRYYTADQLDALFIKKLAAAGDTLTLTSPDGTKSRIIGVKDDGSAQDDII